MATVVVMSLPDRVASRVDSLLDGLIEGATRQARATGAGVIAVAVAAVGWVGLLGAAWEAEPDPDIALTPGAGIGAGRLLTPPAGTGPWNDPAAWSASANAVSLGQPTVPLRTSAPKIFARLDERQPPVLQTLVDTARTHGVDPHLVVALGWHESRWNPQARSSAGAVGALQVKPATVERVSRELDRPLSPHDPVDNATAGVVYLSWLQERFATTRRALIAYNQGGPALRRDGAYPGAEWFADAVLATRADLAQAGWEP